jgi:hypothetical protein
MLRNLSLILCFLMMGIGFSQNSTQAPTGPRVVIPTGRGAMNQSYSRPSSSTIKYPWKTYVTATIFWCGEQPTARNPTPNCMSSWDVKWMENFGGYDNPDPKQRVLNSSTGDFHPKDFVPKLNPFYIALPYNDLISWKEHKPEASKVIPWFSRVNPQPGKTVLKGRWIQIFVNKRSCFAQWEDCGPWVTDDWPYVFGNKPPKATQNGAAGIDISPSVRDYLGIQSGTKVHWRFVEESQVSHGPWKKYGTQSANVNSPVAAGKDKETAQKEYEAYLQELRERQLKRK